MCGCAPALDTGKIVQKKLTKINLLKEPPDKSFHPSSCPLLWFSVLRGIILRKGFMHSLFIQGIKMLCNLHFVQTHAVRNVNICLNTSKESCHLWICQGLYKIYKLTLTFIQLTNDHNALTIASFIYYSVNCTHVIRHSPFIIYRF